MPGFAQVGIWRIFSTIVATVTCVIFSAELFFFQPGISGHSPARKIAVPGLADDSEFTTPRRPGRSEPQRPTDGPGTRAGPHPRLRPHGLRPNEPDPGHRHPRDADGGDRSVLRGGVAMGSGCRTKAAWRLTRRPKLPAGGANLFARFSPSRTQLLFRQVVVFPHSVVFLMEGVV